MGSNPHAFAGRPVELSDEQVLEFMQMLEKLRSAPFSLSLRYIGTQIGYTDGKMLSQIGHTRPNGSLVRPSRAKLEKMRALIEKHEKLLATANASRIAERLPLEKTDLPRNGSRTGVLGHLDRANAALTSALKELDQAKALSVPLMQPGIVELRSRIASLRGWLEVA